MRSVPAALLDHLQESGTTTCRLLKVTLRDGITHFGFCSLDRAVDYDDGDGEIHYSAVNGFDPSTIATDASYSVDNAEGFALISDDISPGITLEQIATGALDDARWRLYLVNYEDLSMGHVLLDAGDLGQVRVKYGLVWIPELLSFTVRLRPPIGHVDSRLCRAIHGSPAAAQTGCGVDVEPLWINGTVTAVGVETDRSFTGDVVTTSPVDPFPGRVQWLTGANAGLELWTDGFDAGAVDLGEPTPFPIEIGDTYRIRPDCRKRFIEDCIGVWNNGINFKGEPLIPTGDASAGQTPGAQVNNRWRATMVPA